MESIDLFEGPPKGRLLTRREALWLIGASGTALLGPACSARAATDTAPGTPSCIARPAQTEGPFFVDEKLNRSDIRSDPRSGEVKAGIPLRLAFRISRIDGASCAPFPGAQVDVWHSDASGYYSDAGGSRSQFLRGYQMTDAAGNAQFLTIYPGGYEGRTVHIHFKIRIASSASRGHDFTSQLYFDDALTDRIITIAPYAGRGPRSMRNADDFVFRNGGNQLLLDAKADGPGYAATFDIGMQV